MGQVETPLRRMFRSIKSALQHASANIRRAEVVADQEQQLPTLALHAQAVKV